MMDLQICLMKTDAKLTQVESQRQEMVAAKDAELQSLRDVSCVVSNAVLAASCANIRSILQAEHGHDDT